MRVLAIALATMSVVLISPVRAQDRGITRISMTIPQMVQITDIQDIELGEWSGSGDLQADQQLCVWSSTGGYSLTGESDNAEAGQFLLAGPDARTADYQVYWDDGSGFRELRNGEALTDLAAARERECSGEGSLRPSLRVRISDQTLSNVASGDYRDQLRLTVVAE